MKNGNVEALAGTDADGEFAYVSLLVVLNAGSGVQIRGDVILTRDEALTLAAALKEEAGLIKSPLPAETTAREFVT